MEIWTIKKLLIWSSPYLQEKGIEGARLESEILLAHVLACRRLDLYLKFDCPLSAEDLAQYKLLIKRRVNHEPVAYIVGKKEFWSRDFLVTRDVLIPRPETEILVEFVLNAVKGRDTALTGLEIGLGSGCLAITLLAELEKLRMHAIEVSSQAIAVAIKNAGMYGVDTRLNVEHGDFLKGRGEGLYDFIVSNPPYVADEEMATLPKVVRDFEPEIGLRGGADGLRFYGPIAKFAEAHLRENGFVAVEIGERQACAVEEIFKSAGFKTRVIKDYSGHDRAVSAYG